jgi:hypothetical protein
MDGKPYKMVQIKPTSRDYRKFKPNSNAIIGMVKSKEKNRFFESI